MATSESQLALADRVSSSAFVLPEIQNLTLDDLIQEFNEGFLSLGGTEYQEETRDVLLKGLRKGFEVFRQKNRQLKSQVMALNVRIGYVAYEAIEQLKKEKDRPKDPLVELWMSLFSASCGVSKPHIYRYKSMVKEFLTSRLRDGRKLADLLEDDSEDAIVKFFEEYFVKNPEMPMKAAYEWALGTVTEEVREYVHSLFATKTAISLDVLQQKQEEAKRRLKESKNTIEVPAEVVHEGGDPEPVQLTFNLEEPPVVVLPVEPLQEQPFTLGTENIRVEQESLIDNLKYEIETLRDHKQVLEQQLARLEQQLEEQARKEPAQTPVSHDMLVRWVEKTSDYYWLQDVAISVFKMAPTVNELINPATGKLYTKDALRQVLLAQLKG